jgi:hypothetical protein
MPYFAESTIEQATIEWLKDLGYEYAFGPETGFDGTVCTLASLWDSSAAVDVARRVEVMDK